MTPEQKAKELVDMFSIHTQMFDQQKRGWYIDYEDAKQCAIICVDELILEHTFTFQRTWNSVRKEYWQSVRTHLANI